MGGLSASSCWWPGAFSRILNLPSCPGSQYSSSNVQFFRYGSSILTDGFESCSPLELAAAEGHLDTVTLFFENLDTVTIFIGSVFILA